MTPERWKQVEEIYHAVLERDSDQRASFLTKICAGDENLRREVESLLAQKTGDELLGHPAWEGAESLLQPTVTRMSRGAQLGPYRIETPLGKGGMGEVFRATDTRLHRTVAIKILPRDKVADPERKKRFLQEARAASALNHPNIVTLHDIASDGGVDYLVMECVPGTALDKLIPPKGLPLADALNYAQQIASGLAAAHAAGVVHRDMKPGNVMVTADAEVKILDFGLAKLAERAPGMDGETQTQDAPMTATGAVMGTVAYMSPEQAGGRPLDHRTDIFSLGIILYEMLAGARPFHGKSQVETLHAIMHDPPPALPKAPPRVQEILDKTLEKDPKERYQSAADLAVDLRRCQKSGSATPVRPPAPRGTPWPWIAAAALVLVVGAAGWVAIRPPEVADNPLANAQYMRFTDFPGDETDAAISRDGKFVAFRSDRDGTVDTWVSQVGSGSFLNLTHGTQNTVLIRNAGFTPDGSEVWLSGVIAGTRLRLLPLSGGNPRAFLSEHAMNLAWSPDGSKIVFHTYDEGDPMFVADSSGANMQPLFTAGGGRHSHFPTWSTDGQWIYFITGLWDTREMDLWRIRPSGGTPERLTHQNSDLRSVAPLDNRTILYVAPDQNGAGPWLWALDTERKVSRRVSSGLETYQSIEASADGRRLAATVSNPTAGLWRIPLLDHPAEERDIKPVTVPTVRALAPRYGGTSLFYLSSRGGGDGLWRYDHGQAIEIWKGSDRPLFEPPAVSFDGKRVAIILRKEGRHTLHILSADGGDLRPLAEGIDVSSAAGWSPDGKWIAAGGKDKDGPSLFKIPVEGGAPVKLAKGVALNPVWSPDGSVIAYAGPAVGVTGPLLMIRPDGSPVEAPPIQVRIGGARYRFVPGRRELVYVPGSQLSPEEFWLLDLTTSKTRRLSNFENHATRTFDISPDGKEIVFDRLRENSDIVLIDRPENSK